MGRLIARLIAAQDGWARPFGDFNHRWLNALFSPIRPVKDFLNGVWLGHPVHSAATDLPIGTLLLTVILDVMGQNAAADIALVATILFMLGAAVTGAADYTDTDGIARVRATLHATLMVIALLLLLISLALRAAGGNSDRSLAVGISFLGFLIVTAAAYVGGDVVYIFGNMVSRHAFRGSGTKWVRLDTGGVTDLATLPEATPTKMKAGINDLVPTPAARWPRARSPTAASNARGTVRASACRMASSSAARPSTTSPRTRSAPRKAAATRFGATPRR
jgi:uncharacterized membrane protein